MTSVLSIRPFTFYAYSDDSPIQILQQRYAVHDNQMGVDLFDHSSKDECVEYMTALEDLHYVSGSNIRHKLHDYWPLRFDTADAVYTVEQQL